MSKSQTVLVGQGAVVSHGAEFLKVMRLQRYFDLEVKQHELGYFIIIKGRLG